MALLLETLYGDLVIDLDVEGSPELCKNIIQLTYCRYYTNTLIFNVTSQRFCQIGCPVGDGIGGACIYGLIDTVQQQQQLPEDPEFDYKLSKYRFLKSIGRTLSPIECQEKGRVVATLMNNTPDTIGSQFLITTTNGPDHALDGYNNFSSLNDDFNGLQSQRFLSLGKVVEDDQHVLDRINAAYCDPKGRPYADIRIIRALVIYDPFASDVAVPGMDLLLQSRGVVIVKDDDDRRVVDSPNPDRPPEESVPKRISAADVGINIDEYDDNLDDDDKYDAELLRQRKIDEEETAKKVDLSRAVVLEMIGDLPDANIRAPENVLFICKLNPITMDEDLELIFSRFDEQVKVEIIRDMDTGHSLQYAFAEFQTQQMAAEAYFKMNHALIDDRRIMVDFSQSVAKLWDRYHQKMKMPQQYNNSTNHLKPTSRNNVNHSTNGSNKNNTRRNNDEQRNMNHRSIPSTGGSNQHRSSSDAAAGRPVYNHTDHRDTSRQRDDTDNNNYRSRNRSDHDRHRNHDRDVDEHRRYGHERRDRDRNDSGDVNEDQRVGKRSRSYSIGNNDERGRKSADRAAENDRDIHRNDKIQRLDESRRENRRLEERHGHQRHEERHDHHHRDHSRSHNENDGSVDSIDEKQRRRRHHHKKSRRSREDEDDDDESDRQYQRHHKRHKKKHDRDRDHDRISNKHHRHSRCDSR